MLALPKRRNVSQSSWCLCKLLRTVSFPILTQLEETKPENACKPKKVAYFSRLCSQGQEKLMVFNVDMLHKFFSCFLSSENISPHPNPPIPLYLSLFSMKQPYQLVFWVVIYVVPEEKQYISVQPFCGHPWVRSTHRLLGSYAQVRSKHIL